MKLVARQFGISNNGSLFCARCNYNCPTFIIDVEQVEQWGVFSAYGSRTTYPVFRLSDGTKGFLTQKDQDGQEGAMATFRLVKKLVGTSRIGQGNNYSIRWIDEEEGIG